MTTHSSILAWRIPGTGEPDGLPSLRSHRVGHNWSNLAASAACFFDDPVDVGNLIFGSSVFSKTSLNIWKFTGHILLKPGLENFECYFTSVWDECNCVVVWSFFGITFPWDWYKYLLISWLQLPSAVILVGCVWMGLGKSIWFWKA